jgi:hypothetical protein
LSRFGIGLWITWRRLALVPDRVSDAGGSVGRHRRFQIPPKIFETTVAAEPATAMVAAGGTVVSFDGEAAPAAASHVEKKATVEV